MQEIRNEQGEIVEVQITADDFVQAGLLSPGGIILPGHPWHDVTVNQHLPPGWAEQALASCNTACFGFRVGSPLMVPMSSSELTDYLHGGEYDERQQQIGDTENLTQ